MAHQQQEGYEVMESSDSRACTKANAHIAQTDFA